MYYCSMYLFDSEIRVRYAETDQMGYVYYGAYAQYYEVGRVELLRSLGISYKKIEELGIFLPVVDLHVTYKQPAFYDDVLIVRTIVKEMPSTKIIFYYEIFVEENLINKAKVVLAFVDAKTGKLCLPPNIILNKFKDRLNK